MATEIKLTRSFRPSDKRLSYLFEGAVSTQEKYRASAYGSKKDYLKQLYEDQKKCYQWLKHHEVKIGLTSKAPARSKMLLGIHEKGSPINNVPARPFLKSALVTAEKDIEKYLDLACEAARDGDFAGVKMGLEAAGQAGVNAIKAKIDSHIPPPNAPITLHGGWMRSKSSGKLFYVKPKKGDTPLVNTGAFRDSFGYEVVYRK